MELCDSSSSIIFFNYTATTEIYTLSLHDALPIWVGHRVVAAERDRPAGAASQHARDRALDRPTNVRRVGEVDVARVGDRKSTSLNSSHANISYAVFCLKKKNY